jgi:flagellar FliL protein
MSDTPAAASAAPVKKKGSSKLLVLGVPALLLVLGGGGAAWWYMQPAAAAAVEAAPVESAPTGLIPFDAFVVNLADVGGRRFIRVSLQLLVPSETVAKTVTDSELVKSRLRSSFLELLAQRTSSDLSTPDGRAALKQAIAKQAHETAQIEVRDVLFQEFVVQ